MSEGFGNPYTEEPKEGPGEFGHKLAGILRPVFSWLGIKFNEDALASVFTSILTWARKKVRGK